MASKNSGNSIRSNTKNITVTAMLAAVATVLMFLDFSIPILVPSFVKLDVSEIPALLASFSLGPVYGIIICLIKNLVNLTRSTTSGVGELCNFILGAVFVFPAGLIYQRMKTDKGAFIGSLAGALAMAILSLPINLYVTYPIYSNFIPLEGIVGMYQAILPNVKNLFQCLLIFNVPFTLLKGLIDVAITFLMYKKLSPILRR